MFLQIGCQIPEDQIAERTISGLLVSCAAVFIALFVVNFIDYVRRVQMNNYIEWDVKTITAGDFTIELDITKDFFNDFKEKEMYAWNQ